MYKRIVVKLGTSVLTGGTRHLDRPCMIELVRQCAALYQQQCDIVVCTSGAHRDRSRPSQFSQSAADYCQQTAFCRCGPAAADALVGKLF